MRGRRIFILLFGSAITYCGLIFTLPIFTEGLTGLVKGWRILIFSLPILILGIVMIIVSKRIAEWSRQ
jgi:hypothetical protein